MSLRSFLDAAEAIMVAEYQRLGMNLVDALDNVAPWRSGASDEMETGSEVSERPEIVPSASQNDQAFQALQTMMMGTSKA